MRIKYQKLGNSTFPVIWRKKGNKETDPCPFCGNLHRHGLKSSGHLLTHCGHGANRIFKVDGFEFEQDRGYILLEYE